MKALKSYLKSNMSYVKTAVIAVLFTLVAIPFVNRVSGDGNKYTVDSRYMVVLNGNELGYVSDSQVAENALLDARNLLDSEKDLCLWKLICSLTSRQAEVLFIPRNR